MRKGSAVSEFALEKARSVSAQLAEMANPYVEYTVDMAYPLGTPVADADTDTITLTGHGFANADVVEITAGAGAIPGGLAVINAPAFLSVHGKAYAYVMNVTDNTFQLYTTWGSVVALDITSAGTVGWKIRKAGIENINITGLSIKDNFNISIIGYGIAKASAVTTVLTLNDVVTNSYFSSVAPSLYGSSSFYLYGSLASGKKFFQTTQSIDFKYDKESKFGVFSNNKGICTDDFVTNTITSEVHGGVAVGFTEVISLNYRFGVGNEGVLMNGSKIIIRRM